MTQFKDKVAIVTGGGRDIGREISLKLAAAGAKVCINYANDEASAQETLTARAWGAYTATRIRALATQEKPHGPA